MNVVNEVSTGAKGIAIFKCTVAHHFKATIATTCSHMYHVVQCFPAYGSRPKSRSSIFYKWITGQSSLMADPAHSFALFYILETNF